MISLNYGRLKRLFNNTLLFALGQFGSTFVSFLLVPLYTNYLTTAEYGKADLVINLTNLLLPLITICITDGVMKFSLDGDHSINQVFTCSFSICLIGFVSSILLFKIIYDYGKVSEYIILFYLILFSRIFYNLVLSYIKSLQKLKLYAIIAIINTVIACVSNIVLLMLVHAGVNGYLTAYVIANTVSIIIASISIRVWKYIKPGYYSNSTLREMSTFSAPLIPNNISNWAMNSMDKYMITYMYDVSYNGVYSVAHKFPSIISMLSAVFNQAWNYSALEEQKNKDYQNYYRQVFLLYSSYMFILASMIMCVIRPIVITWVGTEFSDAWQYTPYLFISTIFSCLTGFYVPLFVIAKKTSSLFISTVAGAVVNLVLNMILIPIWGINGASFATVISYLTVWIIRGELINKYIRVELDKWKAYVNGILLLAQGTILICVDKYYILFQLLFLIIILAFNKKQIYGIILIIRKIINRKNLEENKND